ncbi:hypothetical protein [Anoxynatronum sibiricum]
MYQQQQQPQQRTAAGKWMVDVSFTVFFMRTPPSFHTQLFQSE